MCTGASCHEGRRGGRRRNRGVGREVVLVSPERDGSRVWTEMQGGAGHGGVEGASVALTARQRGKGTGGGGKGCSLHHGGSAGQKLPSSWLQTKHQMVRWRCHMHHKKEKRVQLSTSNRSFPTDSDARSWSPSTWNPTFSISLFYDGINPKLQSFSCTHVCMRVTPPPHLLVSDATTPAVPHSHLPHLSPPLALPPHSRAVTAMP